jgi:hypothetical protein
MLIEFLVAYLTKRKTKANYIAFVKMLYERKEQTDTHCF